MTALEIIAIAILMPTALVCALRAPLLFVAVVVPFLASVAAATGLVDTSSASHPLRLAVPLVGLSVAMANVWRESEKVRERRAIRRATSLLVFHKMKRDGTYFGNATQLENDARVIADNEPTEFPRLLYASIIVFASGCTDVPALFTWHIPGEYLVVPLQIMACVAVCAILLIPERWLPWNP